MKHSGFDRVFRYADDFRHFLDRFVMIVDKIDDFAVFRRQFFYAFSQRESLVGFLSGYFGRISFVFDLTKSVVRIDRFTHFPPVGKRFEAGHAKNPSGHLGPAFKSIRLPPDVDEDVVGQILCGCTVRHESQDEAVNTDIVPGVQSAHCLPVTLGNVNDQQMIVGTAILP